MDASDAAAQTEGSSLAHIRRIWREENYQIIVFVAVQLLVGQAGLLFVLLLTYQSVSSLDQVWDSYLRSGSAYVFAIALLSSACAAVACEFIEAVRDKSAVLMLGRKVLWSVLAALVILFQAGLVGPLLVSQAAVAADVTPAPNGQSSTSATSSPALPPLKPPIRHSLQVALWVLSWVVAFQLFCLGRAKFLHDRYAKSRSEEVNRLAAKADGRTKTFDDEQL